VVLLHGRHGDTTSSTWCSPKWPAWGAILGWLQAKLDHGRKSKVAAHNTLYNFG
jgi:hypothetical protein